MSTTVRELSVFGVITAVLLAIPLDGPAAVPLFPDPTYPVGAGPGPSIAADSLGAKRIGAVPFAVARAFVVPSGAAHASGSGIRDRVR